MTTLTERLDRTIVIGARPDTVFRYFTDSTRWARWWGAGSSIDPRPGGEMRIRYPDGREASGQVIEIDPPKRIVFTYGYTSGALIPPGAEPQPAHRQRRNGSRSLASGSYTEVLEL